MKPSIFFRIGAVLLLIFAALHTIGFRQIQRTPGFLHLQVAGI
jgi:hypothetical protein